MPIYKFYYINLYFNYSSQEIEELSCAIFYLDENRQAQKVHDY